MGEGAAAASVVAAGFAAALVAAAFFCALASTANNADTMQIVRNVFFIGVVLRAVQIGKGIRGKCYWSAIPKSIRVLALEWIFAFALQTT
jgi:hypothetical protein